MRETERKKERKKEREKGGREVCVREREGRGEREKIKKENAN